MALSSILVVAYKMMPTMKMEAKTLSQVYKSKGKMTVKNLSLGRGGGLTNAWGYIELFYLICA